MPYPSDLRGLLTRTVAKAGEWRFEGPEPAIFREAEQAITDAQSHAVNAFLKENGVDPSEIAVIGFHGQTVLHRAPLDGKRGRTRQLGDGRRMAAATGIDVVYDFRSADMAAGGQGAPLSAIYHKALMARIDAGPQTAILNLGGVANLTWRDGDTLIAFDTGPANAPINDWIARHGAGEMDRDGRIARSGRVDEPRLKELLAHPYLSRAYPKSLDRNDFTAAMAEGLDLADGAATLTAFSAGAVGKAFDILPNRPTRLVICGGGRRNPALMDQLARRTGAEVVSADTLGLRGDAIEAECFAYLAVRALRNLPISFPLTTGAKVPMTGGVLARREGRSERVG
jgi:anhydro-N-acetylmuramic acid kinase